jgi:hypothetical protein
MEGDAQVDAELASVQDQIAALRASLNEPDPAVEDFGWVTSRACTGDVRLGEGAGAKALAPYSCSKFKVESNRSII